jgi:hypothetical protein
MSGRPNSRKWKLAVKIALACALAIDAGLIVANWRAASESAQSQKMQRAQLEQKLKLLRADVQNGREIEKQLPNVAQECDEFYQKDLVPASSGDTAVIADIVQIANSAGVQTGGVTLHDKEVEGRGLEEVEITGSVEGSYQNLIQLIDGIERSQHFYLLESLSLNSSSENSGVVKLQIALRTYFRT